MSSYAGARNVLSNNSVYNYMHPGEKANASETAWIYVSVDSVIRLHYMGK